MGSAVTFPIKIAYRNVDPSPAVEADIRKHAERLADLDSRIHWCNVGVEADGKHQRKGRLYRITVNLGLPGKTIAVNRASPHDDTHRDIYVAIRDSFEAAAQQVDDYARLRRSGAP